MVPNLDKKYNELYSPGDKVWLSVESNTACNFKTYITGITIEATIIGREAEYLLLGFESSINQMVWNIRPQDLDNLSVFDRVSDIDKYTHAFWADPQYITILGKVESKPSSNGANCKQCQQYYPYAVGNQPDGTLICYGCKLFST